MVFNKKRFLLLAMAAAATISGCGKQMITSKIEKGIAQRLPEIIGPAKSYRVEVSGHTTSMIKGEMREIRIYGEDVAITPVLTVDKLFAKLENVDFDKRSQIIKSCSGSTFEATVSEAKLNSYLHTVRPDIEDLRVNLRKDKMLVHLRPKVLGLSFGTDVEGGLSVVEPAKVYYKVDRLALAGLKMPGILADYVEEKMNPIQDLSATNLKVRLSSADLQPGVLELKGSADLGSGLSAR